MSSVFIIISLYNTLSIISNQNDVVVYIDFSRITRKRYITRDVSVFLANNLMNEEENMYNQGRLYYRGIENMYRQGCLYYKVGGKDEKVGKRVEKRSNGIGCCGFRSCWTEWMCNTQHTKKASV